MTLAGISAITAYAFLGAAPEAKVNKIKVGEDKAVIDEEFAEPSVQTAEETVIPKVVQVQNTGSVPCFVRVYLDLSDSRLQDKVKLSSDGSAYQTIADFRAHPPADWQYVSDTDSALDGYFYYTKILAPKDQTGDETSALLKSIQTDFADTYDISDFEVIVYSETEQTVDMDGTAYTASQWRQAWQSFLRTV